MRLKSESERDESTAVAANGRPLRRGGVIRDECSSPSTRSGPFADRTRARMRAFDSPRRVLARLKASRYVAANGRTLPGVAVSDG